MIDYCLYPSPCGRLLLVESAGRLCMCDWIDSRRHHANLQKLCIAKQMECQQSLSPALATAGQQLDEYFSGARTEFDIELEPVGTPFQKRVWRALNEIEYGQTATYSEVAAKIGNPRGVRAVAGAIASNPLSVFVPCHRVIAADGTPGGYAGGLSAKRFLLCLEASKR